MVREQMSKQTKFTIVCLSACDSCIIYELYIYIYFIVAYRVNFQFVSQLIV